MDHDSRFSVPPAGADDVPAIPFAPVPRQRRRRHGWTDERQRQFIAALAACGSVTRAARSVGMSARSAYRLLDSDAAESFAAAWDAAIELGIARVRCEALDRAINGAPVAVFRRGRLIGVEHRRNDRLAIALLSGRETPVEDYRRTATSRFAQRRDHREYDAVLARHPRGSAEANAAHDAIIERIEAECAARRERPDPRIRFL